MNFYNLYDTHWCVSISTYTQDTLLGLPENRTFANQILNHRLKHWAGHTFDNFVDARLHYGILGGKKSQG